MIKQIRSFYGLKQSLLALYIGTTRSTISMAEGNKRNFKDNQNLRLYRLFLSIPKTDVNRLDLKEDLIAPDYLEQISEIIDKNKTRINRLNAKLDNHILQQQKAINILAGADYLIDQNEPHDTGMINLIKVTGKNLFNKFNDKNRLKLELEIASLKAQQDLLLLKLNNRDPF